MTLLDQSSISFVLSFAMLSELINDEKTRTFLTLEVGAGHHEVNLRLFDFLNLGTILTHVRSFVPCLTLSLLPCRRSASKDITLILDSMRLLPGPFFIGHEGL
jgi:hypothetical protein